MLWNATFLQVLTVSMSARPAADGLEPGWFPTSPVQPGHIEPAPRRVRAVVDGRTVVDTYRARYVWEHAFYPQYYVPAADVESDVFIHSGRTDDTHQPGAEMLYRESSDGLVPAGSFVRTSDDPWLVDTYRLAWNACDAWFEEDEEVLGHPRSPYVRVDAVRTTRHVLVHLDGVTIAESSSPVAVFETGLPPRWYLDPTAVAWQHLRPIELRTLCPYKGHTTGYWNVAVGGHVVTDAAWSYGQPMSQVLPIAGLVAFDDVKLTVDVD